MKRQRRKEKENTLKKRQIEREEATKKAELEKSTSSTLKKSVNSVKKLFLQRDKKPAYSVGVSGRPAPAAYYGHPIRNREAPVPFALSAIWLLLGAAILLYVSKKLNLNLIFRGTKSGKRGRWVRDRSLGGKMVFIEDSGLNKSSRPLWEDLPEDEEFVAPKAIPSYISEDEREQSTSSRTTASTAPIWWAPPQGVKFVSATRKEDLQSQANSILRHIENKKIESGMDYELSQLLSLRKVCHNGGGLTVKPSTESGRDAILRTAIKYSLHYPKSYLGGYEPSRFISGLALDLGVPERRAISIVHGEIAKECKGALIDAEAAFRASDQKLLSDSLSRVIRALESFPMPPQSPEIELVGRSVMQSTTLEFRKAVFFTAGKIDLALASVIAEMVGFNPELVMPQLLLKLKGGDEN